MEQRRWHPEEDLISALASAQDRGDQLSDVELLATCVTLLTGGHETTTGLIGNGILALLQHPDQLRKLRGDPTLLPTAVEELLRYDSPVHRAERVAKVDLDIAGTRLRAGDRVLSSSAARTVIRPSFPDPDRLDVARREK